MSDHLFWPLALPSPRPTRWSLTPRLPVAAEFVADQVARAVVSPEPSQERAASQPGSTVETDVPSAPDPPCLLVADLSEFADGHCRDSTVDNLLDNTAADAFVRGGDLVVQHEPARGSSPLTSTPVAQS